MSELLPRRTTLRDSLEKAAGPWEQSFASVSAITTAENTILEAAPA